MNFIFSSCGNVSVALMQWAIENLSGETFVVYSNTGWEAPFWHERVDEIKIYAEKNGLKFVTIESEGMEALVRRKKGWPMAASKFQFCSDELKVRPAREWMLEVDPDLKGKCFTGIRREESEHRKDAPSFIRQSERHGGRDLFCPLVNFKTEQRNELIKKTGIEILPYPSMECFPCINSNRSNFRMLSNYPDIIDHIEKIENEMGYTRNGKKRTMFRPYRHMGAVGIREVVEWSLCSRGKYKKPDLENEQLSFMPCSSGFCGF
ncbi:MAG: phosphoadenosine phosphosulfate reductase family protein [Actinobacteria bacterium]|nr:phosphoadenosine phosphosulfate reductase family protein [Actinomycetota bacterium]